MKKVAEIANRLFLSEKEDLKGILIGGPGPFKEKFDQGEYLDHQLRKKKLGVVDTSYTGDQGLQELVNRGEKLIEKASAVKERKIMEEFYANLQKDNGLSVYGLDEVKRAMKLGAIDTLLISEDYDWVRVKLECQCGETMVKDTRPGREHKCPNCGSVMEVVEEKELMDVLSEEASNYGTKVEIISTDSREGEQFKNLGGIGGILRFRVS
jgi:peptide chain release factor subunit 1